MRTLSENPTSAQRCTCGPCSANSNPSSQSYSNQRTGRQERRGGSRV